MKATITWLGHSTVRLVLPDERVVFIDPWLTDNPACPAGLASPARCDMILCTHAHSDHIGDVATLLKRFNPIIVGNYDLCQTLQRHAGKGRYEGMNTGGTMTIDGVRVSLTQAYHSSAMETAEGLAYGGMPNGVVVAVEGLASVYHAGDTDVFSDMALIARLFAPKISLLPIGDRFTMGAKGAALAAELLKPATIIPIHYRTFPLLAQSADEFRAALSAELKGRLVVPEVGEALAWTPDGAHAAN
jgi:L-ascorbate metabolism protein UlaG (beta-lactamase superfamily)